MLDAMAVVARRRVFPEHGFEDIECLAIAGITDRMNRHLETRPHSLGVQRLVETVTVTADTTMPGLVLIVIEKPRTA